MSHGTEVCVAHLVRRSNDLSAFRGFVDSYRRCPAGAPHDLLLVFKGFPQEGGISQYEALLDGLPHEKMFVEDRGYDIGTYIDVAQAIQQRYLVFFNSFSAILHAGWLDIMLRHGTAKGVGIVGATGSHQSVFTDFVDERQRLRHTKASLHWKLYVTLRTHAIFMTQVAGRFKPFPSYHVRSNAFLIAREALAKFRAGAIRRKWDAWRFESGTRGLTSQILDAGLRALVVGRDGEAYAPADWRDARTFWIEEQQNLLVSDNQTRAYADGDLATRERYAFHAWRCLPDVAPRSERHG